MSASPADTLAVLTTVSVACNALRMVSYVPQIVAVHRDRSGARAISLLAWSLWLLANFSTGLYGSWVSPDLLVASTGFGNAMANATVIGLTLWKRRSLVAPECAGLRAA